MAAPMRSSSVQEAGHRPRVADSGSGRATGSQPAAKAEASQAAGHTAPPAPGNFEYDDNEWDIGIGDLIIDLDADIEKTTEKTIEPTSMAANAAGPQATKAAAAKMAVEHSATVDKGLKMKIKRTKPGTKTSEAKHEIVKSNEQNGSADPSEIKVGAGGNGPQMKHSGAPTNSTTGAQQNAQNANINAGGNSKRGSSGHRRDKTRDKHNEKSPSQGAPKVTGAVTNSGAIAEMNGIVRVGAPQAGTPRSVFPAITGQVPPQCAGSGPQAPGPPPSPAAATAQGSAAKPEQAKVASSGPVIQNAPTAPCCDDSNSTSPPPSKKLKTDIKVETHDVCVGTSVGTITEPDCLGPCEPGTSVTLEGIVWHETESGVLVVNVTWRGKTYVGTLLDCTRHDWAPPRFCDSPTSDLDNRTPKGRETRSSVHSKLRNGGLKGRRGAANGSGPSAGPSSPTPFVPPRSEPSNKRKGRAEDDSPQTQKDNKKTKVIIPPPIPPPVINAATTASTTTCASPPPSPVLLECPEPNCSKKYKHINGLKYHQSHAHGSADDDDAKDVTSMSENDESNIEAPSPATPVKCPQEKSQDSPMSAQKRDDEIAYIFKTATILDVPSQPTTPRSTPPSPAIPQGLPEIAAVSVPSVSSTAESKNIVKPGVLRFSNPEEFPVGVFSSNKTQVSGAPGPVATPRNVPLPVIEQAIPQSESPVQPQTFSNQLPPQVSGMPSQQFPQSPSLVITAQTNAQQISSQLSPHPIQPPSPACKISSFKVKPTAALMPEEKKTQSLNIGNQNKPQSFKKKNRKSPAGSPHPPQAEQLMFGVEHGGRDEVRSPAYSDISDDGAPVTESDVPDKSKNPSKKPESGQSLSHMSQFGMYPFYGQPQYLVQNVQQQPQPQEQNKPKEPEKLVEKSSDKEAKKDAGEYQQKNVQPHNYYPYGYMGGFSYNMDPNYGVPMVQDDKIKEERVKESPSPIEQQVVSKPIPNPIQIPTPGKTKQDTNLKDKHQNDNHQILKESIEMKNQMNPYLYSRQSQQQQQVQQPPTSHHNQRDEEVRRYYVYEQRRKESQQHQQQQQQQQQQSQGQSTTEPHKSTSTGKGGPPPPSPNIKQYKEPKIEEKDKKDIKQEGVKPTMETQGPPPPPTSQYAYIHHNYMQSPHYGALHFDPNHSMYRGLMVPGPYSANPYLLNTQIPRYHAPEDLSRGQPPTKALDMLEHHAQYYSQHKIHELQERAIKSPTPKTSAASSSPSANAGGPPSGPQPQITASAPMSQPANAPPAGGKQTPGSNKDSRSPPPQRHVHTHHHTHVGLSYPMYPAPYGAAVIASQQAAAVTVINPYPTK